MKGTFLLLKWSFLVLIMGATMVFADNLPPQNQNMPQVEPDIVLKVSPETVKQIDQLFNEKANYKYFHHYDSLESFEIPTRQSVS